MPRAKALQEASDKTLFALHRSSQDVAPLCTGLGGGGLASAPPQTPARRGQARPLLPRAASTLSLPEWAACKDSAGGPPPPTPCQKTHCQSSTPCPGRTLGASPLHLQVAAPGPATLVPGISSCRTAALRSYKSKRTSLASSSQGLARGPGTLPPPHHFHNSSPPGGSTVPLPPPNSPPALHGRHHHPADIMPSQESCLPRLARTAGRASGVFCTNKGLQRQP